MPVENSARYAAKGAEPMNILFQGASIVDCYRKRDDEADTFTRTSTCGKVTLGNGFAMMTAALLTARRPGDDLRFANRGIGGNTTWNLLDRWQTDTIDLKPDMVVLQIGSNDAAKPTTPDEYEANLNTLIERTKAALPAVRFVLLELVPFPNGCVTGDRLAFMRAYQQAQRQMATQQGAAFVALDSLFADLSAKSGDPWLWSTDGIHPTFAGHMAMALAVADAVERMLED